MQKFISYLLLLSLIQNQVLAYSYQEDLLELDDTIEELIDSELNSNFENSRNILKEQKGILKSLKRQRRHISKMIPEKQTDYIRSKLKRKYTKLRTLTSKLLKKKRLIKKLAAKTNQTSSEIESSLSQRASLDTEKRMLDELNTEIESFGNYKNVLDYKINQIEVNSDRFATNINSDLYISLFLITPVIAIIAVLVGVIIVLSGGIAAPFFYIAGGSTLLFVILLPSAQVHFH